MAEYIARVVITGVATLRLQADSWDKAADAVIEQLGKTLPLDAVVEHQSRMPITRVMSVDEIPEWELKGWKQL